MVGNYTQLAVYDRCPYQYFRKYMERTYPWPERTGKQNSGTDVHAILASWVRGAKPLSGWPMDERAYALAEQIINARYHPDTIIKAELKIEIDKSFMPTKGSPWVNGVLDYVILCPPRALLYDWKTGNRYEDPAELRLHALLLHCLYPELTAIQGTYVWLKDGSLGVTYDLSNTLQTALDLKRVMQEIGERQVWPKQRNALCGWCDLKECENWRPR
jgi:hypothetical protein